MAAQDTAPLIVSASPAVQASASMPATTYTTATPAGQPVTYVAAPPVTYGGVTVAPTPTVAMSAAPVTQYSTAAPALSYTYGTIGAASATAPAQYSVVTPAGPTYTTAATYSAGAPAVMPQSTYPVAALTPPTLSQIPQGPSQVQSARPSLEASAGGVRGGAGLQGPPMPPQRLTEGMPDPSSIEQQKAAYAKSLEVQLEQGTKMLEQQNQVQKQALRQAAEMQKEQYNMQVDQQLKAQEMSVDQQANYQLMGLQQAAYERKALLEQQANAAVLDYEQKRVQDEFARTEYEHRKRAAEKQMQLEAEMKRNQDAFATQARAMQDTYAQQAATLAAERRANQIGMPGGQPAGASLFNAIDSNHDGVITREELNRAVAAGAMTGGKVY